MVETGVVSRLKFCPYNIAYGIDIIAQRSFHNVDVRLYFTSFFLSFFLWYPHENTSNTRKIDWVYTPGTNAYVWIYIYIYSNVVHCRQLHYISFYFIFHDAYKPNAMTLIQTEKPFQNRKFFSKHSIIDENWSLSI